MGDVKLYSLTLQNGSDIIIIGIIIHNLNTQDCRHSNTPTVKQENLASKKLSQF